MSSNEIAIRIEGLGKRYEIYEQPGDRLKQFLIPRLRTLFRLPTKKYFREFWALRDISFEVKRGETVGIIGRNGSGKSTLLQIICGTLTPTTGSVQTNGRIAALLELGSGFNPEFTGRENVYLNASVLGLTKQETDARFDDIVTFADIGDFIDQPTKTYSSGMMVRLAFAVIAHVDADILVVDEALAVGDVFFTQKCMRFLRNFMKVGTILFVSHDTNSVRSLCKNAVWLNQGLIQEMGSAKHVSESYLEAFYFSVQGDIDQSKSNVPLGKDEGNQILKTYVDQRSALINSSNLRNDLQVFKFDLNASSFGNGDARIVEAYLLDQNGSTLSWIVGGEEISLMVVVQALKQVSSPIIGFFIKDKLGQVLFGDNTYLSYFDSPITAPMDSKLVAKFNFMMPRFAPGDYSITISIASGSQVEHIQLQWIHDAIHFKSLSSHVAAGIIGIPMKKIDLRIADV
jgi:lipopolysaccharide transport system ATP-binding protein